MSATSRDGQRAMSDVEAIGWLVGFDTTSAKPNKPLIDAVAAYLSEHGAAIRQVPDETGDKANLFATFGPPEAGGIVLSGHSDVVPVEGQPWTSDPFAMTERDGRLYGRGTTDMKGFIGCVLALAPELGAASLTRPVHIVLSHDEEVGCIGVRSLIALIGRRNCRGRPSRSWESRRRCGWSMPTRAFRSSTPACSAATGIRADRPRV